MKLGFVSAILEQASFYETIDIAHDLGFQCVELACWPHGAGERRYAGVSHIDVDTLDDVAVKSILSYCCDRNVEISALAFYPNTMDANLEKRRQNILHLKKVIHASSRLGVNLVTTFIGRNQSTTVEENLRLFQEIWPPIIAEAENEGVRIAIENCPMLFDANQWPGGQNLFTSPQLWREMFRMIPSDAFGINYDPSHFIWQMMDYIQPLYAFHDKIFHVHFKDIKLYPERLNQVGTLAYPLQYMSPKIPGLGDVNWSRFVSALRDIGYDGNTCIEIEDRSFENSEADILKCLRLSKHYMEQFVV